VSGDPVEHHLEVARTARYWTLGDPAVTQEVWFVLHGYMQLARRFLKRFARSAGSERAIVAPEGLSRFYVRAAPGRHGPSSLVGASWMTREDRQHEIADYVAYLDRVQESVLAPSASVTVLGFSQGAATAARWVTQGRIGADRLILWAGFVPPDLDLERAAEVFSRTELVLVRGADDPALTQDLAEQERDALDRAGIAYRVVAYAGGHEIDSDTLKLVAGEP
jgi:predicted esterase